MARIDQYFLYAFLRFDLDYAQLSDIVMANFRNCVALAGFTESETRRI